MRNLISDFQRFGDEIKNFMNFKLEYRMKNIVVLIIFNLE